MDWRKALAYTNGAVDQELQLRTVLSAKTKRSTNRVRQAPKVETMRLHHSNSALDAFCRRMCARMDKPSANTGVAHKLAWCTS